MVTWQGTAPPANRIVALLNYRLGASRIREIVEVLSMRLSITLTWTSSMRRLDRTRIRLK